MGYPMDYRRVINRNALQGGYDNDAVVHGALVRGDLRRLETDSVDDAHIRGYAAISGCDLLQARRLLRAFLGMTQDGCADCERAGSACWKHSALGASPKPVPVEPEKCP